MTQQKQKGNIIAIVMMIALFGMISFVTGLSNPMGVIVKDQFGASNFMSQLGNFANFIAYAFMGIPAGLLLKRTGYKKTALLAIAVGFIGVGIQFLSGVAGSFTVYLTGAFVAGFSMCMLNTVVNPMLNSIGGGGRKGNQLIQVGGTFNSLMATIVPVLVGYFIGNSLRPSIQDANPALFIAMGIFAIAFLVLFFVKIPELIAEAKVKTTEKSKHSALSFRHFILGAVGIFIYVGVEVGIPNISNIYMTTKTNEQITVYKEEYQKQQADPVYLAELTEQVKQIEAAAEEARVNKSPDLKEKLQAAKEAQGLVITEKDYQQATEIKMPGLGIDKTIAGFVVGTYWFLMLIGRFLGVALGARFSSKAMLTFVASLGLLFVLAAIFAPTSTTVSMPVFQSDLSFGIADVPIGIMFLILCGLCTSVMWGGIFNLAVEGLGKYLATASGIFMVLVCGGGILPLIQGAIADSVSYMASFWVIVVGLAYLLFYALVGSKNVNKNIPVD
ncbi:MAG: MFS transporter [Prevotellaceae bacterium]|jgi:FHS family L-fucose permease-like MFS transporter|nr:MFS transporter [Prevotellaceae bacterium]